MVLISLWTTPARPHRLGQRITTRKKLVQRHYTSRPSPHTIHHAPAVHHTPYTTPLIPYTMHHTTKSHTPRDSHYTTTLYTTPHAPHTTHQSLLNSKQHIQITISLSPSSTTYHHHHLTVSPSEEAHNRGCTVIVVISEAEIMFERPA